VKWEGEEGQIIRLMLITEDITAEEILRLELMQSEHLAALGKMAASLAHEINNPLAGIKLYIELLEQNLAAPEKRRQIFATLENSITRIDRIIKNFLSFARQDQPQKEWIDICSVLQGTLDMAANFKQFHQIHIATDFAKDIPLLSADQYRLAQVFVNLLNNASDAMAEAGGRLKISCQHDGKEVFIRFQDTGKGIKQEDLPHIFTPFFTTKVRGHGTGLGLSTSYGIIREHGGSLEVESREGQGCTFTIRLPLLPRE
jgi:signal transduction histidine kinase